MTIRDLLERISGLSPDTEISLAIWQDGKLIYVPPVEVACEVSIKLNSAEVIIGKRRDA